MYFAVGFSFLLAFLILSDNRLCFDLQEECIFLSYIHKILYLIEKKQFKL